jgi:hypothetical protein
MKSTEFLTEAYKIRKVKRVRPDDSIEIKYEVLDSRGVTRKIFLDRSTAESWARENWIDL